jgi:hypothetical protein
MPSTYSRGAVVVLREVWKGRVWKARPWIVVEDSPELLAFYIPEGAPMKVPPGSGIPRDEWTLEDGRFGEDAVRIARPGERHSILHFWREDTFYAWYVNVERPLTRSAVGFDYLDLELDLLCKPDGSWELLDEDELEEAQRRGVIAADEAAAVRAEADSVLAAWPFPTGWEDFRPDPAWPLPQLPAGWEEVE